MTAILVREPLDTQEPIQPPPDEPPPADSAEHGGPYETITFFSTPRSTEARIQTAEMTGDTQTDVVNRALQVYEYLAQLMENGGHLLIRNADEDNFTRVTFE